MNNRKESVERRKHKRVQAKDGALAVLRPHSAKLGQIIDISRDGLAFTYIAAGERSSGPSELDIFFADNGFYLEKVPFETVSDFETSEVPYSSITMRRCGVQFREMTPKQSSQLEYFIQNYTVG